MDPVTLLGLGLGASVLSGGLNAASAVETANAQSSMYNFQSTIAKQNQQIEQQNAEWALNAGESQAATSGLATKEREGQIIAGQGASGFDVNSGSNVRVQQGQKQTGQLEEANIRTNAAEQAYGFEAGATLEGEQASAYSAAATNVQSALPLNIASSFVGGASSVSSKWLQASAAGINLPGVASAANMPGASSLGSDEVGSGYYS